MTPRSPHHAVLYRWQWAVAAAVLATLTVLGGCDGIGDPVAPPVSGGRIQGRVYTGGLPLDGSIEALPVHIPGFGGTEFQSHILEDGRFSLDLPVGRYVVKLRSSHGAVYAYSVAGPVFGTDVPDTVMVDAFHDTAHLDFHLASISVPIAFTGDEADHLRAEVRLYRDGFDSWFSNPLLRGDTWLDGGQGEVQLVGVVPGPYRIRMRLGDELVWLPDLADSTSAPRYHVPTDSVLTVPCGQGSPSAHLSGRIGGAWLELGMTTEPRISLVATDSSTILEFDAERDGTFACDLFWPRPVKVEVRQRGMVQYAGGPSFAEATVYEPRSGQSITGIDLQTAAILVEPDTLLSISPTYLPGRLELYDPEDHSLLASSSPETGSPGVFILPNAWTGEFLLRIVPHEFLNGSLTWYPQWYDGSVDSDHALRVTIIEPDQIIHLPWHILTGGIIEGRIMAPGQDEDLLAYVAEENGTIWADEWLDPAGAAFRFTGLPDGRYKVGAATWRDIAGHYDQEVIDIAVWYPGGTDWDSAGIITIEGANTVEDIDIPLE